MFKSKISKVLLTCFATGILGGLLFSFVSGNQFQAEDPKIAAQIQERIASTPTPTPIDNSTPTPVPTSTDKQDNDNTNSGRSCKINPDCDLETEYCAKGSCSDTSGFCRTRPTNCTSDFLVVCSCDGKTYSNECNARKNGANVATQGSCK